MEENLFGKDQLPRRKNIKRMHVYDAGYDMAGEEIVCMKCRHCGYDSNWIYTEGKTLTEVKRGFPCPKCNQEEVSK